MMTGAESLRSYHSDGQAYYSNDSSNQYAYSPASLSVRYEGRYIRVYEEVSVNSSQPKVGGCRPKEDDKSKSFKERKIFPLKDPFDDYERFMRCGKQELLSRISFNREGMQALKRYVDRVDYMDDGGRSGIEDNMDKSRCMFCKEVRESALAIFQDYMSRGKFEPTAENAVLYLLKRLHRYDELEAHCRKLLSQTARKNANLEHIEIVWVEALVEVGRVSEARKQVDLFRERWGETTSVIFADIIVLLAENDFRGAYNLLHSAFINNKINKTLYQNQKEYINCYHLKLKAGSAPWTKRHASPPPLGNPKKDYEEGLSTGKKILLDRMSAGEKGITELKEHVSELDNLDKNGRGISIAGDRVYPRLILFCLAVREHSLEIFEDYLKQNPDSSVASNGKLFILKRLGRDQELLAFCDQLLSTGAGMPHVEFKRIEALTGLGRFSEALEQVEKSRKCIKDKVQLEIAALQINIAKGDWIDSKMKLESLLLSSFEGKERHLAVIKWLQYCCENPDKFIINNEYLRNYSLSMSISPENGFREWSVKDGLYEIVADSPHPLRDYQAGLMVSKGYLRTLMLSWNEHGLEGIKRYFQRLDQCMDEKQGAKLDPEDKVRYFCQTARKNGLALIDDFLRDNPESEAGILGKVYFLDRLTRYSDIVQWVENLYPRLKNRVLKIELKLIESLSELGRYKEAWKQIDETSNHFGSDKTIMSIFRLHVKAGEFESAKRHLNKLKLKALIDEDQYYNELKWMNYRATMHEKDSGTACNYDLSDRVHMGSSITQSGCSNHPLADESHNQIVSDDSGLNSSEYAPTATDDRVRHQTGNQDADSFDNRPEIQSVKNPQPGFIDQPGCSLMEHGVGFSDSQLLTSAWKSYCNRQYINALSILYEIKDSGQSDVEVDGLFNKCIKEIWGHDWFGK